MNQQEADDAGMLWTDDRPHPNSIASLGRNNRTPAVPSNSFAPTAARSNVNQLPVAGNGRNAPQPVRAEPIPGRHIREDVEAGPLIYNADGTIYSNVQK